MGLCLYMNVPTYLVAQNVHGPCFTTPFSKQERVVGLIFKLVFSCCIGLLWQRKTTSNCFDFTPIYTSRTKHFQAFVWVWFKFYVGVYNVHWPSVLNQEAVHKLQNAKRGRGVKLGYKGLRQSGGGEYWPKWCYVIVLRAVNIFFW